MAPNDRLRERSPLKFYAGSTLLALVALILIVKTAGAVTRPATVAEIALYQGPDREPLLIEGAKKVREHMLNTIIGLRCGVFLSLVEEEEMR